MQEGPGRLATGLLKEHRCRGPAWCGRRHAQVIEREAVETWAWRMEGLALLGASVIRDASRSKSL